MTKKAARLLRRFKGNSHVFTCASATQNDDMSVRLTASASFAGPVSLKSAHVGLVDLVRG